jgi:hypothetical protein
VPSETVPFSERGGRLRGALDAVSGRFPGFVFGGPIAGDILPVFHFHDESRDDLEPKLRYLAENGYRSITSHDIARFVEGTLASDARLVALCFDDVWASVWTVAAPLLKQYELTAIAYAIPGRIEDSAGCRAVSTIGAPTTDGPPLVTWPELRALQASGVVDVQCHTYSHSKVFCSAAVAGYVTPDYESTPLLNRPSIADSPTPQFVSPSDLGAPLYLARSRMSDGLRVSVNADIRARALSRREQWRSRFFDRPSWREELDAIARDAPRWQRVRGRTPDSNRGGARSRSVRLERRAAHAGREPRLPPVGCLERRFGGGVEAARVQDRVCEPAPRRPCGQTG